MYEGILRDKTIPPLEFLEYVVYFALYSALMERFREKLRIIHTFSNFAHREGYVCRHEIKMHDTPDNVPRFPYDVSHSG